MSSRPLIPVVIGAFQTVLLVPSLGAQRAQGTAAATEYRIPVAGTSLYARVIGSGVATIVLHGGPDFDHAYLLPELDRLDDVLRLIYYDQRGRGLSAAGVHPDEVSLASDVEDVNRVLDHFHLDSAVVLGHSWGAVLALEYARRYPARVTRLILMNPAPVAATDLALLRRNQLDRLGPEMDRQRAIIAGRAYQSGDPDTVAARYRIHFKPALAREADYETLMARMRAAFVRQGSVGILEARAVEDRLLLDTWAAPGYDLRPALSRLRIPTLVIAGDRDFIPVEVARHIADAIPGARLAVIENCGHFGYMECPDEVRREIDRFLRR